MKVAESKTKSSAATTAAKTSNTPFFSKESQGSSAFFGGETAEAAPFFSPRTIQPKLTIGKPNDHYEQQADAVADQVVAKITNKQSVMSNAVAPTVQTKCDHCEQEEKLQKKEEDITPVGEQVQMKPIFDSAAEPPPDDVQRKGEGNTEGGEASSDFSSQLSSSKGGGQPLPADTQQKMGSAMGADFSNVRIHTGSEAAQMSDNISAQAFTHGNDVYFNEGKYNPSSTEGSHLLAHELTHTVQQGAAVKRKPDLINPAVHAMHITNIQREQAEISKGSTPHIQRAWYSFITDRIESGLKNGLNWAAERLIPGYSLLNVILGKNLITGAAVERSGVNIVKAYMRLVPVIGSILLSELEETDTLTQAGAWTEDQVAAFGINFDDIAKRLTTMWDEISVTNGIDGNVAIFRRYIGPVLGRFLAFSSVMEQKMKELRLEGALLLVGATDLLKAIKESPAAFKRVVDNPKEILNNFMEALKRGFASFKDNFGTHFKNALFGWLLGKAASMGVQMPKEFSVAGVFHLVAQLAGLTYDAIKALVIEKLGPKYGPKAAKVFAAIEKGVAIVQRVITEGPMALWEMLKEQLTNLKDMVISQITELVTTEIIKSAVTKLLSMLNPAGALVQLIMTLYRVIKFFVDNWATIAEIATGIISSITQVALGALSGAAAFIEKVLAKGMQMIISFLARIFGLDGIAEKVKKLLQKLGGILIKARDWVVNWLVEKGKEFYEKLFGKDDGKEDDKGEDNIEKALSDIDTEGMKEADGGEVTLDEATAIKNKVNTGHPTKIEITNVKDSVETWDFEYIQKSNSKSPKKIFKGLPISKDAEYSSLYIGKFGKQMHIEILSRNLGNNHGSPPPNSALASEEWQFLVQRRNKENRSFYVQGHLLNENLGGPGESKNLAPIPQTANSEHLHKIEKKVKKAVLEDNKVVRYTVWAEYGRRKNTKLITMVDKEINRISNSNMSKNEQDQEIFYLTLIKGILGNERHVPKVLFFDASELELGANNKWNEKQKMGADGVDIDIDDDSIENISDLKDSYL